MGFVRSFRLKWVLNWLPAALAVAMIAAESTAVMSADNTSHWLLPVWVRLFGPISAALWEEVHHLIRKTGHFVGYGLVSLSFFHGWRSSLQLGGGTRRLWRQAAVLALFSTLLVASADEYHQTFLPGRTGTPVDVGLDMCGATAALLLILALLPLFASRGPSAVAE
jgi:VanZ family protein